MTFMSSLYGRSQQRLSSLIESLIGNNIVNQEQSFSSFQMVAQCLNPVTQMISQFYRNDIMIGPKPVLSVVRFIVS